MLCLLTAFCGVSGRNLLHIMFKNVMNDILYNLFLFMEWNGCYSWGHLVVPYTEELISRPFLDENSI